MNFKFNRQQLVFVLVFISLMGLIVYRFFYVKSINDNPYYTVGRIYEFSYTKSVRNVKYKYYYENRLYKGLSRIEPKDKKVFLNDFYKVRLSKTHPSRSEIILNQKVEDTLKIIKAGFHVKKQIKK